MVMFFPESCKCNCKRKGQIDKIVPMTQAHNTSLHPTATKLACAKSISDAPPCPPDFLLCIGGGRKNVSPWQPIFPM